MNLKETSLPALPSYYSKRSLPQNFKKDDRELFEKEFERYIQASKAHVLEAAVIVDETIWDWKTFSFLDQLSHPSPLSKKAKIKRFPSLLKPSRFVEKAIWMTDTWAHNYFHWMTESIPRLIALEGDYKDHKVVLPKRLENFNYVSDSLNLLGYDHLFFSKDQKLTIASLVSFDRTAPSFNYHQQVIKSIRNRMKVEKSKVSDRKIYVSRRKAGKRKIVNEEELILQLMRSGYEIHQFEDYSLAEQIQLMNGTSNFISMHGAGLTNMLFMEKGAKVLEFRFRGDTTNNCFYTLASELGHLYYYSQNDFQTPNIHLNSNMILDIEDTLQAIADMESLTKEG
ncbi:glycosyltransferase family 61 protein [Algoriphagus sp. AGSA1]|uniref:glycosyltransferase family 61 protein n=1 Tax=Algoriphagus sp. AGSA1 TaxID=2907213 RepID=UPI001F270072|nr:glycosyltransferase family 61 protein [Algoriphagus sp. AGSA1]MCE7055267.1 glycosyltransferase family 61 protein [Algoriphagus sp. AGSA1]